MKSASRWRPAQPGGRRRPRHARQVATFAAARDDPGPATVSTPGKRHPETGEMVHHDGGHWWYVVPEGVDIPKNTHDVTLGDGDDEAGKYSVLFGARYVLIPPSVRPEGKYKATGTPTLLTDRLAEAINERAQRRAQRAQRTRERVATGKLTAAELWGNEVPWDDILADTGWINTGYTYSGCGCDIWTAPGPHASERSAVAHEPGCSEWADSPDPPLYCFTTHAALRDHRRDRTPHGDPVGGRRSHPSRQQSRGSDARD